MVAIKVIKVAYHHQCQVSPGSGSCGSSPPWGRSSSSWGRSCRAFSQASRPETQGESRWYTFHGGICTSNLVYWRLQSVWYIICYLLFSYPKSFPLKNSVWCSVRFSNLLVWIQLVPSPFWWLKRWWVVSSQASGACDELLTSLHHCWSIHINTPRWSNMAGWESPN